MNLLRMGLIVLGLGLMLSSCDTRMSAETYRELNEQLNSLDPNLNPYFSQIDTLRPTACRQSELDAHIACVIQQFQPFPPPIEVGPLPEIPLLLNTTIRDSLFIIWTLGDQAYFQDPERMYGYWNGKQIDQTDQYTLCLIMTQHLGVTYELVTIAPTGARIDRAVLGSEGGDAYSIFGKLPDARHFETQTHVFDWNDNQEKIVLDSSMVRQFEIQGDGTFAEISAP
ncbi:hypothetical protein [Pontibacter sp. G13]|uniref:hypothetical protein n=1 Tax=Pontibacter sp. G13 TaxID=3074898 RepID=UPI002889B1D3|nr:hypothetical protein [Pontibacter sp. G13]WNJ18370.1 hypothetical protein RJD25_26245 [Pontibacter sp. G13]